MPTKWKIRTFLLVCNLPVIIIGWNDPWAVMWSQVYLMAATMFWFALLFLVVFTILWVLTIPFRYEREECKTTY